MKQQMKYWLAFFALSLLSFNSFSQNEDQSSSASKWISDKGYWVIESNINEPLQHLIRFYNNDDVLVYKEALAGVKLNPAKRKVKMMLKTVLESSLLAWEKKRMPEENMNYVAAILK